MARTQQGRPQGRQQARRIVEPRPEKPTGARDAGAFEYQLPLPKVEQSDLPATTAHLPRSDVNGS